MKIINLIKDFLENAEFNLVINLSDIITVIVFLFTIGFNIYTLKKEKKRFQINLSEQHEQFRISLKEQKIQFEEQMKQQSKQYEDNRNFDLKKNQVECLPIILLKEDIMIEKSSKNSLKFYLKLINRGSGSAYACHPIADDMLCIYTDKLDTDLKYHQMEPGADLLNFGDSVNITICSSKLPNELPHDVFFTIEYYDLMGRKYNQEYRFIYNFPKYDKATRIGNYLWNCVEDIDKNTQPIF